MPKGAAENAIKIREDIGVDGGRVSVKREAKLLFKVWWQTVSVSVLLKQFASSGRKGEKEEEAMKEDSSVEWKGLIHV